MQSKKHTSSITFFMLIKKKTKPLRKHKTENIRFERMRFIKPNKFQAYHLKPLGQFFMVKLLFNINNIA